MERIQKIIASRGVCSRREAERLISEGRVTVDGVAASVGQTADENACEIKIDGRVIPAPDKTVYVMLNKPRGVITSMSDDRGRRTVAELVADCPCRIFPVGRLDYDSDGLLLMTNDGELANKLMHPSGGVFKTYRVTVKGNARLKLSELLGSISVDGRSVRAKSVNIISSSPNKSIFEITIGEGRNRQVRRMCDHCGLEVVSLTRISEGSLQLGDLEQGCWRYLTTEEIYALKSEF